MFLQGGGELGHGLILSLPVRVKRERFEMRIVLDGFVLYVVEFINLKEIDMFAVLRFLHIIAGIIWAGGAILMNLVIGPAIGATGDAGRQFAGHLMGKTAFSKVMLGSGLTTVLAGTYLYSIAL